LKIATAQKKLVDCPALVEPKYTDQSARLEVIIIKVPVIG